MRRAKKIEFLWAQPRGSTIAVSEIVATNQVPNPPARPFPMSWHLATRRPYPLRPTDWGPPSGTTVANEMEQQRHWLERPSTTQRTVIEASSAVYPVRRSWNGLPPREFFASALMERNMPPSRIGSAALPVANLRSFPHTPWRTIEPGYHHPLARGRDGIVTAREPFRPPQYRRPLPSAVFQSSSASAMGLPFGLQMKSAAHPLTQEAVNASLRGVTAEQHLAPLRQVDAWQSGVNRRVASPRSTPARAM